MVVHSFEKDTPVILLGLSFLRNFKVALDFEEGILEIV